MSEKKERKQREPATKLLYRVETKTSDGQPYILTIRMDDLQFIVAQEKGMKDCFGKQTLNYDDIGYYPSAVQAIMAACDRIARKECTDLSTYVRQLNAWRTEIIHQLADKGLVDPLVKA